MQTHCKPTPLHSATPAAPLPPATTGDDAAILALHQTAHNALACAAWHVARGEPAQALNRIRRAQTHLRHAMQGRD